MGNFQSSDNNETYAELPSPREAVMVEQGPLPAVNPIPRLARISGIGPRGPPQTTRLQFQPVLDVRGPPRSLRHNANRVPPQGFLITPKAVESQDMMLLRPAPNRLHVLD